jgi:hypothetical protein
MRYLYLSDPSTTNNETTKLKVYIQAGKWTPIFRHLVTNLCWLDRPQPSAAMTSVSPLTLLKLYTAMSRLRTRV